MARLGAGELGELGEQGEQGEQGKQREQGEQGEQGELGKQCRDVPWRVWKLGEMRRAIAKPPPTHSPLILTKNNPVLQSFAVLWGHNSGNTLARSRLIPVGV